MTRNDLYKEVSKKVGVRQDDVKTIGNAMFDIIMETVSTGEKVSVFGFGVFEPKTYDPHQFFNPVKKEYDMLPARTMPRFTASRAFKDNCRG